MFNLFKPKTPAPKTSTITFDEAYCHSGGGDSAQTYEIAKGTTELVFAFPDFDGFMARYYHDGSFPLEIRQDVIEERAYFCAQIVDGALYICGDGIDDTDRITFNAETLVATDASKPFTAFTDGAIAFGIQQAGGGRFFVLWATMYRSV